MIVGRVSFNWGSNVFEDRFSIEGDLYSRYPVDNAYHGLHILQYNKKKESSKEKNIEILSEHEAMKKLKDSIIVEMKQSIKKIEESISLVEQAYDRWEKENINNR